MNAYSALWAATAVATPVRIRPDREQPLTPAERETLHAELQKWYYESGNGMLLTNPTRTMFLKVKDNLILEPKELKPKEYATEVQKAKGTEADAIRGKKSIEQLSLLRTRMKADFRLFGIPYGGDLDDSKKEFLADCGERLWKMPWRKRFRWLA